MVNVKIFGSTPPCAKCKELEKRAKKVAEKYPGRVEVLKLDAISAEGEKYNVILTPAVVINDKVIASGKVISEGDKESMVSALREAGME